MCAVFFGEFEETQKSVYFSDACLGTYLESFVPFRSLPLSTNFELLEAKFKHVPCLLPIL